jgi:hypothetical protein
MTTIQDLSENQIRALRGEACAARHARLATMRWPCDRALWRHSRLW